MNAPLRHPIVVARRMPFSGDVRVMEVPDHGLRGATIAEILACQADLSDTWKSLCEARINDQLIERRYWNHLRLKPNPRRDVVVTFTLPLGGGGGSSGGKSPVATVASIAVLLVAAAVSGGALGPAGLALLGSGFAAGTVGAAVAGAAIGIGGALAIAALVPPPSLSPNQAQNQSGPNNQAASISGNVLSQGDPVPRVIGTFRLFPPFISPPLIEIIGDDTVAEAVYGLAGPHSISDPLVGTTAASTIDGLQIEIQEGLPESPQLGLIQRQSFTDTSIAVQMSQHQIDQSTGSSGVNLLDQANPINSCPQWEGMTSRVAPDEVWIHLLFAAGLSQNGNRAFTPFRLRIRQAGTDTWINLPEFHVVRLSATPFQVAIKLMWQGPFVTRNVPPNNGGPVRAFFFVPQQNQAPADTGGWQADPYFFSTTLSTLNLTAASTIGDLIGPSTTSAEVFDGVTSQTITSGAVKVGTGNISGQAGVVSVNKSVSGLKVYALSDIGFTNSANKTISLLLEGSNDNFSTDVHTVYQSVNFTSFAGLIFSDTFSPVTYEAFRLTLSEISGDAGSHTIGVAECQLQSAGDTWLDLNNVASTTGVVNMDCFVDRVEYYLNDATKFPQSGSWEMQLIRGQTQNDNLVDSSYSSGGNVYDYFGWITSGGVAKTIQNQTQIADTVSIERVASIWNESPVPHPDVLAVVGVKVTNRTIDQLSVLASGYTYDYDGSGWNTQTTTSNPAPHFRDILAGNLGGLPLTTDVIDDASIIAWRQQCIDKNYTCDAPIEGKTYIDALKLAAQCGYAQLTHNEKWGVFMDRDRSGDSPIQIFTPRNMKNFAWTKALDRLPTGIRASYFDSNNVYTQSELVVFDDPSNPDSDRLEQITYDGLVTQDSVAARAQFDLTQAKKRLTFYQGTADAEAIVCQRGDLVAVQNDILDSNAGFSRIASISRSAGNITGLTLDGTVPVKSLPGIFSTSHLFTVDSIFDLGTQTGMGIRLKGGNGTMLEEIDGSSNDDVTTITFTESFADPGTDQLDVGCLVTVGRLGSEYRRLIVYSIKPNVDMTADLTFVDEAPELFSSSLPLTLMDGITPLLAMDDAMRLESVG